jgi:PAS domain S-box-containing protein
MEKLTHQSDGFKPRNTDYFNNMKQPGNDGRSQLQHESDLAEAERCRKLGKIYEAMELYDRAIQGAAENGCIQAEAFANEIASKFYLEIGKIKIAKVYAIEAYLGYNSCGDTAKVKELKKNYADLIVATQINVDNSAPKLLANSNSIPQAANTAKTSSSILDLVAVMKASEAIQSEITSDNLYRTLLRILRESAGAQKGCLILKKADRLFVEAIDRGQDFVEVTQQSTPVESSQDLPISAIDYVAKTQYPLVLDNLDAGNIYQTDPYIKRQQPKSALCAPIFYQSNLIGIFYLENNLATNSFTIARLELLALLASQAAIALENARLYAREQERSQQLQQKESQYRSIFEAANDGIAIFDLETYKFIDTNLANSQMYGYSREEWLKLEPQRFIHPNSLHLFEEFIKTVKAGKDFYCEATIVCQEGTLLDIEVKGTPYTYNNKPHALCVARDISERKRAEKTLRQSEQRFRNLFEATPKIAIQGYDRHRRVIAWNRASEMLYGYTREEALGQQFEDLIFPPKLRAKIIQDIDIWVNKGIPITPGELELIRKDSSKVSVYSSHIMLTNAAGELEMYSVDIDLSDRKHTEDALRHSETQLAKQKHTLKAILNAAPIWIWMTNTHGKMQFVNKTFCQDVGIPACRFIEAEHYREILGEEIAANCMASDSACLAQETPHLSVEMLPFADGKIHNVEVTKAQIKDSQGQTIGIIGLGVDATERAQARLMLQEKNQHLEQALQELQQAQTQLIQNEKMSALGNLVAGVAHEINNPIGFLNGSINNISEYIQDIFSHLKCYQDCYPESLPAVLDSANEIDLEFIIEDLPKIFDSMKLAVDRIRNISTSLRTFSRADSDCKVACNIHEGIDSTLLILKYRLKANEQRPEIKTIKKYSNLPLVECFSGQLNQVFMNILANAIDSIEESNQGRTFAEIKANPNTITVTTDVGDDNRTVVIKIKDSGKGMSEEVKARIFEHLFTTKGVGKGTGLGLSISRQIVEETHKGSLTCYSVLGEGTEFAIVLPLTTKL